MANIKQHLDNIKNAIFGKDVRTSIHDGIYAINKEVEGTTKEQQKLSDTFKNLTINAGNSNAEIVAARGSKEWLPDRLDENEANITVLDSQIKDIENNVDEQFNALIHDSFVSINSFPRLHGETDDTKRIKRMIDYCILNDVSRAKILNGDYYIESDTDHNDFPTKGGIVIPSDFELLLENCVLHAVTNNSHRYSVLRTAGGKNINIIGTNAKINGNKSTVNETGEWGHGIMIVGSQNVTIDGIEIYDCFGDGIFVGARLNGSYPSVIESKDVFIKNCDIHNNRRQGISIVACDNCNINNNKIYETSGTAPECGIDIEGNGVEITKNIKIHDNYFYNNRGKDILNMTGKNVTIHDNLLSNSLQGGISCYSESKDIIVNCKIYNNIIKQSNTAVSSDKIGILVTNVENIDIFNNVIEDFKKYGIYFSKSEGSVKNNSIQNCDIGIIFGNNIEILNNSINNSLTNSIMCYDTTFSQVFISNNTIYQDHGCVINCVISNDSQNKNLNFTNNTIIINSLDENIIRFNRLKNSIISHNNITSNNVSDNQKLYISIGPDSHKNLVNNNTLMSRNGKVLYGIGESLSSNCSENIYAFNILKNVQTNSNIKKEESSQEINNVF